MERPWEQRPIVGITCDVVELNGTERHAAGTAYARAVERAGGTPVLLPPSEALVPHHLVLCDAFVFTGGDDPRTEPFGEPTHPRATPVHPERQAYETALLGGLKAQRADAPVLGVCLGMQMMGLAAGGRLDQHLPETLPTHTLHWKQEHAVDPDDAALRLLGGRLHLTPGPVRSVHRQALRDPGTLVVIARSPDGVIEGVADPRRRFYVGVQWHPERTPQASLGAGLFEQLIGACRGGRRSATTGAGLGA